MSAFCGAVLGIVMFLLVRPALAGAALVGTRYFESDLTPTSWGYLAMLVGRAGRRGHRRAGVAAPGADLPARRGAAGHAQAPDVLAADRARDRRRGLRLRAGQDQQEHDRRGRLSRPAAHHDRPRDRRSLAHRAGGTAVRPPRRRIVGAAGGPAARRQPETCLPGGDRPHAGGLPRHDGRPDRARGELDRRRPPSPGRSATSSSAGSGCQRRQASTSSAGSAPSPAPPSTRCTTC